MMMTVRIRRLHDDVPLPRYESAGAAAFDLSTARDVLVQPGEVALVGTGLVIEVPAGMFLAIFARSSTPLKRWTDRRQRRRRHRLGLLGAWGRSEDRGAERHAAGGAPACGRPDRAGHLLAGAACGVGRGRHAARRIPGRIRRDRYVGVTSAVRAAVSRRHRHRCHPCRGRRQSRRRSAQASAALRSPPMRDRQGRTH